MSGVILLIETFFAERCLATVNLKAPRAGLPTVAQIPLLQAGSSHTCESVLHQRKLQVQIHTNICKILILQTLHSLS